MGYELDNTRSRKCPCGNGTVKEMNYSDDWFRFKTDYSVECTECRKRYHIQEMGYTKPDGEYRSTPYLVPKGKSLHCPSGGGYSYNIYTTPFYEQLCMRFSLADLTHISSILKSATAHSKINDYITLQAFKMSKSSLQTLRVSTVRTHVLEAVEKYHSVAINYDKKEAKLVIERKLAEEVRKESICIYDLDLIK